MRISKFLYPPSIARCQHVKVNGVQCGSPSLKNRKLCHFHQRWQQGRIQLNANHARRSRYSLDLPILEDANSIQVALMQGMRLLLTNQVDHRTAALLFYALQTASSNLSRTTFEPRPQQVVIDPSSIADTSLGDDAWYKEEFTNDEDEQEAETKDQPAAASAARVDIHAMADCARVEPAPQLLGGAAVHRCGKSTVLNKALAAEAISMYFQVVPTPPIRKKRDWLGSRPDEPGLAVSGTVGNLDYPPISQAQWRILVRAEGTNERLLSRRR
jgi:hypothetical protein